MYNVDLGAFGAAGGPHVRLTTGSYGGTEESTAYDDAGIALQGIVDVVEDIGGDVVESELVKLQEGRERARYYGLVLAQLPVLPVEVTQWFISSPDAPLDKRDTILWSSGATSALNKMPGFSIAKMGEVVHEGGLRMSAVVRYRPDPANESFYAASEEEYQKVLAGEAEELIPIPPTAAAVSRASVGLIGGLIGAGVLVVGSAIAIGVAHYRGD